MILLGIVSFAAYNTQNNLLYLMLSVGIASVVVCLVGGFWSLRSLSVSGVELPDAYAGVPFYENVRLRNSGRALDAFGLGIEGDSVSLPLLRRGADETCRVERLYRRRGLYDGDPVAVSTRFPFGFFRFSRQLAAPRELLVYPRIRPINGTLVSASRGGPIPRAQRRGQGDEFFRLRDYVPGDHIHHIHWKTSAKLDEMIVRELGEDEEERLCVGFVPMISGERDPADFEVLVSAAASLVSHLAASGARFRFIAEALDLPPASPREQAKRVLAYLALVSPQDVLEPSFLPRVYATLQKGEHILLVAFEDHGISGCRVLEPKTLLA